MLRSPKAHVKGSWNPLPQKLRTGNWGTENWSLEARNGEPTVDYDFEPVPVLN